MREIPCHICGKLKGQPPDRCPGHYEGTESMSLYKTSTPGEVAAHDRETDNTTRTPGVMTETAKPGCTCQTDPLLTHPGFLWKLGALSRNAYVLARRKAAERNA
jgi:hypothetical protein